MYRIKTVQMVQDIYRNLSGPSKPIAYFSLGWRMDAIIFGFLNNMCAGQVLKEVIDAHRFQQQWIDNPEQYVNQLTQHLKPITGYEKIKERDLTDDQWKLAKNTGTNLTALSSERIEYLVCHAENLT